LVETEVRVAARLTNSEIHRLLVTLAAGKGLRYFTPMDWESHLNFDDNARAFAKQVRLEWRPPVPPDDFCRSLVELVRERLFRHPHGAHIWTHTLRVTGHALALAPQAEIDPAHAFALGLLHDVGKLEEAKGGATHEEIGAQVARDALDGTYSPSTVTLISTVIAKRASRVNPYTRLLHDADKLDKIGATGIARRLAIATGDTHITTALLRVREDLIRFHPMHFPFSDDMAIRKKDFTFTFLDVAAGAIPQ
jgi:5'-deoxynucleotidase YfbR-like HD superfamily hydrolase